MWGVVGSLSMVPVAPLPGMHTLGGLPMPDLVRVTNRTQQRVIR